MKKRDNGSPPRRVFDFSEIGPTTVVVKHCTHAELPEIEIVVRRENGPSLTIRASTPRT